MKETIEKIAGRKIRNVVKLHGDASYREYFRAFLDDGTTRIIMQMPKGRSSVSEEITNFKGVHKEIPFVNIDRFLASLGLPVPKIERYDEAARVMVLEDLGDSLLAGCVKDADRGACEKWYKKAIDLLVNLQKKTFGIKDEAECVALQRSFDPYLLNWEFDHFREYLVEARLGREMEEEDRELFEKETRKITDEITKIPYCFTHRDFQSRNLIVRDNGELSLIDFQDALMGPCIYDLVALLRDSYVELEWGMVEGLAEYYSENGLFKSGSKAVQKWFNLVTLQRKMKDAGRFIYIDRVKKNPNFLQYIPTTLRYIKNALEETYALTHLNTYALCEALKKYVPEWN
ncbi:MAG: aminoglycoside phosphotransferase [Deltaproteobacteria bacterium CG11_big_fil_rev_8_21_14_0_20_49_13]|nr:MAG: aminoglycoside phosphotransferase [Deltaproteobacteria bacterium CG11_big_fil_rev_8_21_14_0_20_49_13]